jgi:hypothetical protein
VGRCRRANLAALCKFFQSLSRQYRVQVLLSEGSMAYLRVNDPHWLDQHVPSLSGKKTGIPGKRADRAQIDRELAVRIDATIDAMLKREKPLWITKFAVLQRTGMRSKYRSYPGELPRSDMLLRRRVETRSEFVKRKIEWGLKKLKQSAQQISLTKLRATTSLPVNELMQYTTFIMDIAKKHNIQMHPRTSLDHSA